MLLIKTATQSSFLFISSGWLVAVIWFMMVDRLVLITISDQHGVNKDGKIPYCAHSMFATKEFILLHPLAKVFKMVAK